eukprot:gene12582-2298_t
MSTGHGTDTWRNLGHKAMQDEFVRSTRPHGSSASPLPPDSPFKRFQSVPDLHNVDLRLTGEVDRDVESEDLSTGRGSGRTSASGSQSDEDDDEGGKDFRKAKQAVRNMANRRASISPFMPVVQMYHKEKAPELLDEVEPEDAWDSAVQEANRLRKRQSMCFGGANRRQSILKPVSQFMSRASFDQAMLDPSQEELEGDDEFASRRARETDGKRSPRQ